MLTRQELETKLIARSWEDPQFLADLKNDPKATIEKVVGEALPADLDINIAVESENEMTVCIPSPPSLSDIDDDDDEINSEQLAAVAGGGRFNVFSFVKPNSWRSQQTIGAERKWSSPKANLGDALDVW